MSFLDSSRSSIRTSLKVATIVVLLLLLLIPLGMIRSLVDERSNRSREAAYEIVGGAGGAFALVGPLIELPYRIEVRETVDDKLRVHTRRGALYVIPDQISVEGILNVEYRTRGIYRVPVYRSSFEFTGDFTVPDASLYPDGAVLLPDENRLVAGIADMRGMKAISPLRWGARELGFVPDFGDQPVGPGLEAVLGQLPSPGNKIRFSWDMELSGGESVSVAPLARNAELTLSGNWPSPSFQGAILPDERELTDDGFTAVWRIPEVGRPLRSHWDALDAAAPNLVGSNDAVTYDSAYDSKYESMNMVSAGPSDLSMHALKVKLLEPVGLYSRTERSVKYGVLFVLIPFVVFFLFETLGTTRIHPVQYLLAAVADLVFYLLLLSLSEHLGFATAYIIAAAATTVLMSFYTASALGKDVRRWVMPVVLFAAYLWLWVTLQSEDYALLIGAVGLFVLIALVMVLTRKVNWYGALEPSNKSLTRGNDSSAEGHQG